MSHPRTNLDRAAPVIARKLPGSVNQATTSVTSPFGRREGAPCGPGALAAGMPQHAHQLSSGETPA
eukprot:699020-Pleurochrysis_carterae.AAC.1